MSQRSGKTRRTIKPEFKDKVRKRDDFRCRMCLKPSNELQDQLQVHHIRPVEMGGRDRLKNLISLCRICHRIVHKDVESHIDTLRKYVSLYTQTGNRYTIDSIEKGYYLEF
jgi:5-methylcytosine-specific restriction endonuclease McrA